MALVPPEHNKPPSDTCSTRNLTELRPVSTSTPTLVAAPRPAKEIMEKPTNPSKVKNHADTMALLAHSLPKPPIKGHTINTLNQSLLEYVESTTGLPQDTPNVVRAYAILICQVKAKEQSAAFLEVWRERMEKGAAAPLALLRKASAAAHNIMSVNKDAKIALVDATATFQAEHEKFQAAAKMFTEGFKTAAPTERSAPAPHPLNYVAAVKTTRPPQEQA
ncbi:hypothetical protein CONPUDRAFT_155470 [Coniophora puteana RWD-64-598 SS2]|uniref:Uncharacterized protein n=1 Tax=Coniophora puteana (strain RWD-64-598) TaxID=741705 RepID=A0A5M3MM35_CONPW|nr:uncharacterized protein CONPUDRAFT_155470 [Coniophora puteana RWD-64-598 SS2]EIW80106.1 hypothetical protein CONPUDRAFT_155470 [Coniophora puteana RWD-64-598 SS2]